MKRTRRLVCRPVRAAKVAVALALLLALGAGAAGAAPAPRSDALVTWPAPRVARVVHDRAIFRVGPTEDHDRRTPLERGALLLVRGQSGSWLMADLGGGDRGWVEQKDVEWVDGVLAEAVLRNVLVRPGQGETLIDVQMTSRTSYDLVEVAEPAALVLRLHRTTSMINELAQYAGDPLVRPSTVRQVEPQVVELRFPLAKLGPWGYSVSYGSSPNLPGDPAGHDFRLAGPENLRITLAHPPGLAAPPPATASQRLDGITVIVDPGHGGDDYGAVGVGGLKEKDVNLAVGLALRRSLERRGARVVMTRDSDRELAARKEDELTARVEVARANRGTLFISVHHNARARIEDARVAYGAFIYYYQPWSAELARALMDPVAAAQSQRVRAYVFRSFAVTRQTYMPSVLVEVGFISNPEEERKMAAPDYAPRIGEAIATGVERWLAERMAHP